VAVLPLEPVAGALAVDHLRAGLVLALEVAVVVGQPGLCLVGHDPDAAEGDGLRAGGPARGRAARRGHGTPLQPAVQVALLLQAARARQVRAQRVVNLETIETLNIGQPYLTLNGRRILMCA
jgi:hypothetical protein